MVHGRLLIIMLSLESVWPFLVFDVVTLTESNHPLRLF
jgi:hypothetical protein